MINSNVPLDLKAEDGMPYWRTRGADTWHPFKNSSMCNVGILDIDGSNFTLSGINTLKTNSYVEVVSNECTGSFNYNHNLNLDVSKIKYMICIFRGTTMRKYRTYSASVYYHYHFNKIEFGGAISTTTTIGGGVTNDEDTVYIKGVAYYASESDLINLKTAEENYFELALSTNWVSFRINNAGAHPLYIKGLQDTLGLNVIYFYE